MRSPSNQTFIKGKPLQPSLKPFGECEGDGSCNIFNLGASITKMVYAWATNLTKDFLMSPIGFGLLVAAPIFVCNLLFDLSVTTNLITCTFAITASVARMISCICDWQRWQYEQYLEAQNKIARIEDKLSSVNKWFN